MIPTDVPVCFCTYICLRVIVSYYRKILSHTRIGIFLMKIFYQKLRLITSSIQHDIYNSKPNEKFHALHSLVFTQ